MNVSDVESLEVGHGLEDANGVILERVLSGWLVFEFGGGVRLCRTAAAAVRYYKRNFA